MNGIAQSVQLLQMENDDACVGVYKEAASKVVELQRQVISLRAKLKQKESVDSENERLKKELSEFKLRQIEL
jgi:cell shape-determining protein MreC